MEPKAVVERTMVAPCLEGRDTDVAARSRIRTWIVWLGIHVPATEALMHRTKYCLPQAAPLSHIPSPAAPNRLLEGNCDGSLPWQAVAVHQGHIEKRDTSARSSWLPIQRPLSSMCCRLPEHLPRKVQRFSFADRTRECPAAPDGVLPQYMGLTCVGRAVTSGRPDVTVGPGSKCRQDEKQWQ